MIAKCVFSAAGASASAAASAGAAPPPPPPPPPAGIIMALVMPSLALSASVSSEASSRVSDEICSTRSAIFGGSSGSAPLLLLLPSAAGSDAAERWRTNDGPRGAATSCCAYDGDRRHNAGMELGRTRAAPSRRIQREAIVCDAETTTTLDDPGVGATSRVWVMGKAVALVLAGRTATGDHHHH